MATFREILPQSSIVNGHVILYKAWLKSLMNEPTENGQVSVYDLNLDKDRYGLSEEAAIAAAFNQYGMCNIFDSFTDNLFNAGAADDENKPRINMELKDGEEVEKPSTLKFDNNSSGDRFLNENILTIAQIKLVDDETDGQVIVLPEGAEDVTPEMLDPYYDPAGGTLYATIKSRIADFHLSHNRILNLRLDKDANGIIRVSEMNIEEIQLA